MPRIAVVVPGAVVEGRTPAAMRRTVTDVDVALATIRSIESANDYTARARLSTASGAYQYIDSSWGNFGGFVSAYLAPPETQDQRARLDVEAILNANNGDASAIPVIWYLPAAATNPELMDIIPSPEAGNRLTPRQYQQRWMERYAQLLAQMKPEMNPGPATATLISFDPAISSQLPESPASSDLEVLLAQSSLPPVVAAGQIAFPVLGPVNYVDTWNAPRDGGLRRHEGTDLIGVKLQPVLAAVDGVITKVRRESGISGNGVSITGADGYRYGYYHLNNDSPASNDGASIAEWTMPPGLHEGDHVRAGQIIGYMGNSGNAEFSVTHLHFEIRQPDGTAVPSYAQLVEAQVRQACTVGVGPWSTTVVPAPLDQPVAHTVARSGTGRGTWTIDTEGRVVATGDAAIIGPNEQCADGVSEGFGSDAAGWQFSVATPVPAALTAPATPLVRISDVFQMPTQGRSIEFVQAIVPGPQPTPAEPLRWIFKTL